ncbi:MAG: protein kinase [Sandaracinaceae bacterium]
MSDALADRYDLLAVAARGGMGIVYRARDRRDGSTVAVKVALGVETSDRTRFERECRALEAIDHPAVVRTLGHGHDEHGTPFLAMEWVDGDSLAKRLKRGRLSVRAAFDLGLRVADALSAVHQASLIHRDVKPSNILLPANDEPAAARLADFGLAVTARRSDDTRATETGAIVGTLRYMSPEQARGLGELDARTDVYALGAVLYECVVGRPLLAADDPAAILLKLLIDGPELEDLRALGVPAALDALLRRMLRSERRARPRDGSEVAARLRAIVTDGAHLPTEPSTASSDAAPSAPTRRGRVRADPALARERSTGLVGRGALLAELEQKLDGTARLVTLLGPPGIGKSALVRAFRARSPRLVYAVDLAAVSGAEQLAAAILTALGAASGGPDPAGQLEVALEDRGELILALDPFEELVPAGVPLLERLLASGAQLGLLVASRRALGSTLEHLVVVPPLSLPGARSLESTEDERHDSGQTSDDGDAMELLIEHLTRARGAVPTFGDERDDVRELVAMTEGLPLAIELLAGQLDVLDARSLLERHRAASEDALDLDRGPSLARSIRRAWDALSPVEAHTLAQCTVFAGGFRTEAAEAVVRVSDPSVDARAMLVALRRKSWLRVSDDRRISMFDVLRRQARERIAQEVLAPALERHAAYYVSYAAERLERYERAGDVGALEELLAETGNLMVVARRGVQGDVLATVSGLRALSVLRPCFDVASPPAEYGARLEELMTRAEQLAIDDGVLAHARYALALFRESSADPRGGETELRAAIELAERFDQREVLVLAHRYSMTLAVRRGRMEDAREHATAVADAAAHDPPVANAGLDQLAVIHMIAGDVVGALSSGQRALAQRATLTSPFERASAFGRLANIYLQLAHHGDALECVAEVHRAARALKSPPLRAYALGLEGSVAADAGDHARAIERFELASRVSRIVGQTRTRARWLVAWAAALIGRGDEPDLIRADGLLSEALQVLDGVEALTPGWARAYRGYLLARRGAALAATAQLDAAERTLTGVAGTEYLTAARMLRLAADVCAAGPQPPSALRARVLAVVAGRDGSSGARARSEVLRAAIRVLERDALAWDDSRGWTPAGAMSGSEGAGSTRVLRVDSDGGWFEALGEPRVALPERSPLRRLLAALAERAASRDRTPATLEELITAAWPGERLVRDSGEKRLRMSISRLRKLGLADRLVTTEAGYRLDGDVQVVF